MTRWTDYTAALTESDHRQLIIALGAGLQEARHASECATRDGTVEDARRHVITAIVHLSDALPLLVVGFDPPPDGC